MIKILASLLLGSALIVFYTPYAFADVWIPENEYVGFFDSNIPDWVRNNAGWWSQGLISDGDFIAGIQYLISKGVISI